MAFCNARSNIKTLTSALNNDDLFITRRPTTSNQQAD